MLNALTVVITAYKRPAMLWECYESVVQSGVANIVIAIAEPDEADDAVLDAIGTGATIARQVNDQGANATWLDGVSRVTTPLCSLLYDDDYYLPPASGLVLADCAKALGKNPDVGFALWDAIQSPYNTPMISCGALTPGLQTPDALLHECLLDRSRLSLSPVVGMFRTESLLASLLEAEEHFHSPEFHSRPAMMIGNDLLIWLNACIESHLLYYVPTAGTACRAHEGSETTRCRFGLLPCYNATRDYFMNRTHMRVK